MALALVAPRLAHATGESCMNDIDCKTGSACGGEICDWNIGMKCAPATATGSGHEGWCTTTSDCKCAAQGATCAPATFQCTKTVDTGAGGGTGTAGATGNAGSSAAGSAGASSSTVGSANSAAGSSSTGSDDSSGGCSISERAPKNAFGALLGAACAAALVGARRRRRAA